MGRSSQKNVVARIGSLIHNRPLASGICRSLDRALRCSFVRLAGTKTVWGVFNRSLDAAIRDIKEHPRGELFQRLVQYGPHHPDDPESLSSDGKTVLSDPECGDCVEFIYSHMINRFKGELAELLALEPCIGLVQELQKRGSLPSDIRLHWGEVIQERRRKKTALGSAGTEWGNFVKGADGLLARHAPVRGDDASESIAIHGIVEIKSMVLSAKRVIGQINRHMARLRGGLRLGETEWTSDQIVFDSPNPVRIMIVPASWTLSRDWDFVKKGERKEMVFPEPAEPPTQTSTENLGPSLWKITLAWSREAIEQAAYEMTYWYMSQVGRHVWRMNDLPKGWGGMSAEEAGYNAIKMVLYYIPLRYISERQDRLATRLYNVYCFGYPLGVDSREMLWPEDFSKRRQGGEGRLPG